VSLLLVPVMLSSARTFHSRQADYATITRKVQQARRKRPTPPSIGVTTAQKTVGALSVPASQPFDILYQLSEDLPEKVQLTDLSFDRGKGTLILKGHADANATVASTMRAMTEMAIVERAMIDYVTASTSEKTATPPPGEKTGATTTSEQTPSCDFQITCSLKAANDPTILVTKKNAA
jgi:Tfp pilus assembly protein PilN